jgi:hypothetical protein
MVGNKSYNNALTYTRNAVNLTGAKAQFVELGRHQVAARNVAVDDELCGHHTEQYQSEIREGSKEANNTKRK